MCICLHRAICANELARYILSRATLTHLASLKTTQGLKIPNLLHCSTSDCRWNLSVQSHACFTPQAIPSLLRRRRGGNIIGFWCNWGGRRSGNIHGHYWMSLVGKWAYWGWRELSPSFASLRLRMVPFGAIACMFGSQGDSCASSMRQSKQFIDESGEGAKVAMAITKPLSAP